MSSPQSKARVIGLKRPLKDVTLTAGETATFECELSYEGIAAEWFLGGTKLEPSDRVSPNTPDRVLTRFLHHEQADTLRRSLQILHESRPGCGSGPELGPVFPPPFVHSVQFSLHLAAPASACLHIRACWWRFRIPAEHLILVLR